MSNRIRLAAFALVLTPAVLFSQGGAKKADAKPAASAVAAADTTKPKAKGVKKGSKKGKKGAKAMKKDSSAKK